MTARDHAYVPMYPVPERHTMTDSIALPVIPKKWTVANAIAFAGSAAVSIIGVLTMLGYTVPSGVSAEVQSVTGALTVIAGAIVGLVGMLSRHSVVKTAIKAGVDIETATRL